MVPPRAEAPHTSTLSQMNPGQRLCSFPQSLKMEQGSFVDCVSGFGKYDVTNKHNVSDLNIAAASVLEFEQIFPKKLLVAQWKKKNMRGCCCHGHYCMQNWLKFWITRAVCWKKWPVSLQRFAKTLLDLWHVLRVGADCEAEWASGCRCCHWPGRGIAALTSQHKCFPELHILARTFFFLPSCLWNSLTTYVIVWKDQQSSHFGNLAKTKFWFTNSLYKNKQFNLIAASGRWLQLGHLLPAWLPRAQEVRLISIQRWMMDHSGGAKRRQRPQSLARKVFLPADCNTQACTQCVTSSVKSSAAIVSSLHRQSFPSL